MSKEFRAIQDKENSKNIPEVKLKNIKKSDRR